jgi:DNA-binding IclR family transcriptional regulator
MSKKGKEDCAINNVLLTFRMLEELSKHHSIGVTELANSLCIYKSHAFRLLKTFEHAGYVVQDRETSNYGLTSKIRTLTASASLQNGQHILDLASKIIDAVGGQVESKNLRTEMVVESLDTNENQQETLEFADKNS